jgi:hypothetical protein
MPDPGENIQSWSTTASDNANADNLINWIEHMPRADVNNSARSMMAATAKDRDLHNGTIITTGAADAQLFSSGYTPPFTTIPNGMTAKLKVGPALSNTATMTLSMDGITAVTVKNGRGLDLTAGEWRADSYVDILYDGTNWRLVSGGFGGTSQVTVINNTVINTSTGPVALVDFTNLDSALYSRYQIVCTDFVPEINGQYLALSVSTDNGVTFPIDKTDYQALDVYTTTGYVAGGNAVALASYQSEQATMLISWAVIHGSPQRTATVILDVFDFKADAYPSFHYQNSFFDIDTENTTFVTGRGHVYNTAGCNALRLWASSGNIISGKFVLYGHT